MSPTPRSDEEIDRLLASLDPIDRQVLHVESVASARDALGDAIVREARSRERGRSRRRSPSGRAPGAESRLKARVGRRRLVLSGVAAGGLAAAVLVIGALLPGRETHDSQLGAAPASAATILERAANTAMRQAAVFPSAHQYEYLKVLNGLTSSGGTSTAAGRQIFGIRFWQTYTTQTWSKPNGAGRRLTSDMRERFFAPLDRSIARAHDMSLAQLDHISNQSSDLILPAHPDLHGPVGAHVGYFRPGLPTQPDALLAAIKREMRTTLTPPTAANVFNVISTQLLFEATSPALRAALYRVIAHLPGVHLLGRQTDQIGRRGIAVTILHVEVGNENTRRVMLFDPATSEELQTEEIQLTPIRSPNTPAFPAGTPLTYTVFIKRGIVNSIQDLPGGGHLSAAGAQKVIYEPAQPADTARFNALYRETNADLLAFLLRRCPTPEDAADCLAETYLVAWNKRDQIPAGAEVRPWLFGVARNVMRRGHQSRDRLTAAANALASTLGAAHHTGSNPPDEERERLLEALADLSAIDRDIITMIAWDDLMPSEIAPILGLSPNVVRVRAHRARARIRSSLSSSSPELDHNQAYSAR